MITDRPRSPFTIHHSLLTIKSRLAPHTDTPLLDAQVLLAHLTGRPRTWLIAHPEAALNTRERQDLEHALTRLENGVPLPYVLGEWEFYGLKLHLTPDVLIPRPETEILVEDALRWLHANPSRRVAVDVGTGAGGIAIALAAHTPQLRLTATDLSATALQIARQNAARHNLTHRLTFFHSDILFNLQSSIFDLILANLPYIPTVTLHTLAVYGREPTLALDGGPDGLHLIGRLLAQAQTRLAPGGLLLAEIDATHGQTAPALARQHFPQAHIQVLPDLAGHPRVLKIQTPEN